LNVQFLMEPARFNCSILPPINMKDSQYAIFRQTFDFFDWLIKITGCEKNTMNFRLPSMSYRLASSTISGHYPWNCLDGRIQLNDFESTSKEF
jgi:hypothetical protein